MTSFTRQYSTASPVLAMQPQASHQHPLPTAGFAHQAPSIGPFSTAPADHSMPQSLARSAGRKRSRDEAAVNLDAPAPTPPERQEEWVYGEGMVLIKPNVGYVADASSQSGTWLEEKKADEQRERHRQEAEQRPILRSHKSQRIDASIEPGTRAGASNIDSAGVQASNGETTSMATAGGPVIDECTVQLGIGWRRISDDEHIQAAARGWARFIANHFALVSVRICLESKGLQSYLVESSDGYFLFAEDLRRGRLVSKTVHGALRNLQQSPPAFDGPEIEMGSNHPSAITPSADTEMRID
ncbi:NADH:ubiquinone oxidoreductase 6.6kD subunit [Purpureocillium lavendulum]|uniref:NADH:ubiquinone oxidoreductase 6.6kD subunit n=1 Tax=Purpureocillium lavendulum TaxID=1247861 RepID=A0AB34FQ95_9HYPO|nr:NADH:ubiquinone oxidoreductase 6.6kD subunit [Purpureocillium lavendulum]